MSEAKSGASPSRPHILSIEQFAPHVGKLFQFIGTPYAFPLDRILGDAGAPASGQARRPFALIFRGPRDGDVLPEGLYDCATEDGASFNLYVAPIHTPQPDRQEYQAAFN
ncbi:MAG: hypothetical protein KGM15_16225 [Pseudomonadota bacterium]|nr:hypothetical protein [Pseudomonadota bacterium]